MPILKPCVVSHNHSYIKSLHQYFDEYNSKPISKLVAQELGNSPTKILYYWLYLNRWNKGMIGYRKIKNTVLSHIHDMWALNLFTVQKEVNGFILLDYKASNSNKKLVNIESIDDFRDVRYTAGPKPSEGEWYGGDLVSCKAIDKVIHKNITSDGEDYSKKLVLFPMPTPQPKNSTIALEFRRIPQLLNFHLLTAPCKKQDEIFWTKNINIFKTINQ